MKFPGFCLLIPLCLGFARQAHADDDKLKNDAPYYGGSYAPASASATPTFTPKVRLAVDYGIAHIYGESKDPSSAYSSAADDLRTGGNLKLSGAYMLAPKLGLGVAYSHFTSNASISDVTYNRVVLGNLDIDLTVDFIGAILAFRSGSSGAVWTTSIMLGQSSYDQKFDFTDLGIATSAKGTGFGLGASFGGEYYFNPHVSLGIEVNSFQSNIKNIKVQGQDAGSNDVSNIGASGGLRVYL